MASTTDGAPRKRIREQYSERVRRYDLERESHARRARLISLARLVTFLGGAGGVTAGFWGLTPTSPLALAGGAAGFAAFIALVFVHERVLRARDRAELLMQINTESLMRMSRRWNDLPEMPVPAAAASEPVARDLDLFPSRRNRAALYQLLGTVNSPQGRATLATWLRESASAPEVARRQAAVAELAPLIELRQELELRGRQLGQDPPDPEKFLEWAEGEPWLHRRLWLVWLTRLLAAATVTAAVLKGFDMLPVGWLILLVATNLLLTFAYSRRIKETYDTISGREQACRHYAGIFQLLDDSSFESEKLQELDGKLRAEGRSVSRHMQRLGQLGGMAEARFTPLFHLPLVALTLWDFHVLFGFERWQQGVGRHVRHWFEALGEIEALSALATLRHDHPDWTFPKVVTATETESLRAEGLGHPLLPPESCVVNDVDIGPPGKFLLVTGSNMSGKSTLLRSIGVNVVLAQAGGPVYARSLVMPSLVLGTSFRVHDSLEAGVSFFMAELRRLKQIVDLARRHHAAGNAAVLYLLDEILQGTNVYERQVAVRRVILHLLRYGAIGAVSTHDLTLADADTLADACDACNFAESYENGAEGPLMHFDYQLRPGVASTRNALKLLEIVGLGDEDEPRITLKTPIPPEL